ncbi:MAG: tRNA (N(6)-L-threonylcarbamoyladenosine(37)-C(2))-methylthiotransferase MtaB [Armatimonadetes bacterium]|nr:tRNA (N(6)-L-threonylcarbamoyladenosine(37)-C(2))-methylthiotransferase MtaB [Armatimonadota bacterium]NIO75054.1 tRNA (N(6)-L-threonylcarbamoyladenosine(37)-C(2))-methylthiotransferase MtaB [Armatimonadota bacterium]NIO95704.1 tRNA (N(6)-L-threonylcarbamoyladenosine(37)-C(2))-methylthiotransferase MtaB [Armatimonadota bacterium]
MKSSVPKVHIITLGCKVNQCDGEELGRALTCRGFQVEIGVESDNSAGVGTPALQFMNPVFVVNTCTVTSTADAKARKLIRRLAKDYPGAKIIVTGCYAQRDVEAVAGLGDNILVVPNRKKPRLAETIAETLGADVIHPSDSAKTSSCSGRTRAFVKVQDGCDHGCTYCIVPAVRGPMMSKPLSGIVEEVASLCEAGMKEVVLCGIRLGAYGADLQEGVSLAHLLRGLREIPIPRLRLSSLEPLDISEDLIAEFNDHPGLCHHLHLPVQSGDDGVLAAMGRGYTLSDYRRLVERIRRIWPDLSLTTDVMVGFPEESEAAFENTLEMMREFDFTKVHVFRYSARPGTPAAAMKDQVPEQTKRARMEAVQELAEGLFRRRAEQMMGRVVEVLIEGPAQKERADQKRPHMLGAGFANPAGEPAAFTKAAPKTSARLTEDKPPPNEYAFSAGRWEGLTPHYLRVEVSIAKWEAKGVVGLGCRPQPDFLMGEIIQARITGAGKDFLVGELAR